MKKIIKILAVIFAIVALMAVVSCKNDNKKDDAKKEDKVKEKITVLTDKNHEQELKFAADNFKKVHENVDINLIIKGNIYEKLEDSLNSKGNPVDILCFDDQYVQYFVNKLPGAFLDVTGDINSYKDRILKSKIDNLTFSNKVYGFPWSTYPKMILYRSDIFSKEGINVDDIKTWNDYIDVGKKVSKDTGKKFMANTNGTNNDIYLLLANQLGTSYFNRDGKINFNSKEWMLTLKVVKSLYSEGIIYELGSKEAVIDAAKKMKLFHLLRTHLMQVV